MAATSHSILHDTALKPGLILSWFMSISRFWHDSRMVLVWIKFGAGRILYIFCDGGEAS